MRTRWGCINCVEGWTGPAMYDWLLGPHEMEANAGDWVRIDFGETLSFSQIALVLTSGAKLDLFTTNDTTKWGNPLSSFTVPTSDTVTLNVPTQHARYLKIVNPGEPNGAWWHIFDVTLWSPLDPNSIGLKNQKNQHLINKYNDTLHRSYNLNGRKSTR